MPAHTEEVQAFAPAYVALLRRRIRASPWFTAHTLNRDFVGTRGFSIVFRSATRGRVVAELPDLGPFLERVLRSDCNAFYLNPLELERGSRVDPHVDRSLRSYLPDVPTPTVVSVLYLEVPRDLRGGELVLSRGKKHLARITPVENALVTFDGDLTHAIERLESAGKRLSLVCEQYSLSDEELAHVPEYVVESRARGYD
jgi:hypothetical protein